MTVAELRKALEGVPDDMLVTYWDETWFCIAETADIEKMKRSEADQLGDFQDCEAEDDGEAVFVIR